MQKSFFYASDSDKMNSIDIGTINVPGGSVFMALKKVLVVLLVIFMVFGIAACGTNSPGSDRDDNDKKASSRNKDDDDDDDDKDSRDKDSDDKDSDDKDSDEKGSGGKSSGGKDSGGKSSGGKDSDDEDPDEDEDDDDDYVSPIGSSDVAGLPDGFPTRDYPFMRGTEITYGTKSVEDQRKIFIISGTVSEPLDEVKDFYFDLLNRAEGFSDLSGDGYYVLQGKYAGYEFYIVLAQDPTDSDNSTMMMQIGELLSTEAVLENLYEFEKELPDDYPLDLFPIIDNAVVTGVSESEYDGRVSYDITVVTSHSFKEIVAFYDEQIRPIEGKSKSVDDESCSFSGMAYGYFVYIGGYVTTEYGTEMRTYYIALDPVD